MDKLLSYLSLFAILYFLWKHAYAGLIRNKFVLKLRGNEKVTFTNGKAKFYGFLFLLAALGMTWISLLYIKREF